MDDIRQRRVLEAAEYLAAIGLAVHWLRPPRGGKPDGRGKAPVDRAWQLRPWQSPSQLRDSYRPGYNVGVHTGNVFGARVPVVVVDCDDENAEKWCREHLPRTPLEARTRAGRHLYYRASQDAGCRAHVGGLAIDIRADGGNIVAPPSLHPEGTRYQWTSPISIDSVAKLPQYHPEWFACLKTAPSSALPTHLPALAMDTYQRACAYARATPPAVQGQGGSLATFKLAVALVRGFALPQEQALTLLLREFNPRCEPPWTESELTHKLRYAAEAGRVGVGSLLAWPNRAERRVS